MDERETHPAGGDRWRIDDLAQRAGVSVDTVRFYQREGLLPPANRSGRLTLYGPAHLIRLHQIRDLQERNFSLGSIRLLVEEGRLDLVQTLFASGEGSYDRDELISASGLTQDQVARLEEVGLIVEPKREGRPTYDNGDLQVLQAIRALMDLGLPEQVTVFLARIKVEHFEAMLQEVLAVFQATGGPVDWPEEEREAFKSQAPEKLESLFPLVQRILNYTYHRTILRMTVSTLEAEGSAERGPGAPAAGPEPGSGPG